MIFVFNSSVAKFLNVLGIVIWPFVFIVYPKEETPPSLMKHELVHVKQIRREGVVWFYLQYVLCLVRYYIKYGEMKGGFVKENKWEEEAYALEVEPLTDEEMVECKWPTKARTDKVWKGMITRKKNSSRKSKPL